LLVGVGSATLSGGAVVAVRAARRYDSAWTVFAAFSFVGVIFTVFPAFAQWRDMTAYQWLSCLTIGGVSLIAQVLMTHALGVLENATAGVIGMLTVLSAMALGYVFDGERLSALSGLGAGLTLVGTGIAARVSSATKQPVRT
jgi:drug/metabolite transporter (DMT)-like permease